jgi:hypothetical protein
MNKQLYHPADRPSVKHIRNIEKWPLHLGELLLIFPCSMGLCLQLCKPQCRTRCTRACSI